MNARAFISNLKESSLIGITDEERGREEVNDWPLTLNPYSFPDLLLPQAETWILTQSFQHRIVTIQLFTITGFLTSHKKYNILSRNTKITEHISKPSKLKLCVRSSSREWLALEHLCEAELYPYKALFYLPGSAQPPKLNMVEAPPDGKILLGFCYILKRHLSSTCLPVDLSIYLSIVSY